MEEQRSPAQSPLKSHEQTMYRSGFQGAGLRKKYHGQNPYARRPQQSADGGDEAQGSDAGEEAGEPADGELGAVGERDEAHKLVRDPEGGLRRGPARGWDVGGRRGHGMVSGWRRSRERARGGAGL
jgi:hypothetical protein